MFSWQVMTVTSRGTVITRQGEETGYCQNLQVRIGLRRTVGVGCLMDMRILLGVPALVVCRLARIDVIQCPVCQHPVQFAQPLDTQSPVAREPSRSNAKVIDHGVGRDQGFG